MVVIAQGGRIINKAIKGVIGAGDMHLIRKIGTIDVITIINQTTIIHQTVDTMNNAWQWNLPLVIPLS